MVTAKKAFDDASVISDAAKATWTTATDLKTKGNPTVLKVEDGTSNALATTTSAVGDTAITPGTGTDGAAAIYNTEYLAKATHGYTTIHTAKIGTSNSAFDTWKTTAAALEEAEQLYTKLNNACTASGLPDTAASLAKTCTKLMSGYAEWKKQLTAKGTQGTAAVTAVTAVTLNGKLGDMTWTNVKLDTTAALTQNVSTYAAAVTVVNAVTLAEGTGAY